MKNRIISWLLLACMAMSALLTSCSNIDTGYVEETSTIPAITLNLYGIKGEGTTDEAIALVEAQINRITEDDYKTTVKLNFFDEEDYAQTIEDAFVQIQEQTERNELAERAALAAAKAAREAAKALSPEEQKEKKRAQREYTKWAEQQTQDDMGEIDVEMSDDVQMDIFMVYDYEYYRDLVDRELITDISADVTGTYGLITKFVHPTILSVAKLNGSYYGVPSNRLMLSDKRGYYYAFRTDLVEKYGFELTDMPALNLNAIDLWLEQIKLNERGVVPFFAPPEVIQHFDFYCDDMELYPAYGTKNNEAQATTSNEIQFTLHSGVSGAMSHGTAFFHFRKMYRFRQSGYFAPEGAQPATTDFAMGVFKGTLDEVKALLGDRAENYSYATYAHPRVTTEDVFASTFVVSSSCKYPSRAVELICGLTTDESLRNLITFGVENVHYELNNDGETITKLTDDYNIDFYMYGNSLIGYVPEELGANYQADAIQKNRNVKSSAFVGYTHELEEEDVKAFEQVNKIVGEYIHDLMNGYDMSKATDVNENGVVDIDDVFEEIMVRLGKNEDVLNLYPDTKPEDFVEPYLRVRESLDGNFVAFAGGRPGGGVTEIDNTVITKEEQKRREEAEALLNPETQDGEELSDPSAEGEILPEATEDQTFSEQTGPVDESASTDNLTVSVEE